MTLYNSLINLFYVCNGNQIILILVTLLGSKRMY